MDPANFDKTESDLKKLLASNKRKTFEFWLNNVKMVAPKGFQASIDQQHYVARFLTRFSLVSSAPSMFYFQTFTHMAQIYDEFILDVENQYSPQSMEIAGCQTLLLGGFYLESAEKHYAVQDIISMGKLFFTRGATGKRKKVIKKMAWNFEKWQVRLQYLEWYLRNEAQALVIHAKKPDEPLIKIALL